ncbi:MAG: hypothetical protein IJL38_04105 [Bacteroidales bacterium]|nr:hypothetical protein [Bacteroidales bacterium]
MKNIFRILSVALVAGSMLFVACGKEDDPVTPTPSNPTDTTSTPTTPTDTTTPPAQQLAWEVSCGTFSWNCESSDDALIGAEFTADTMYLQLMSSNSGYATQPYCGLYGGNAVGNYTEADYVWCAFITAGQNGMVSGQYANYQSLSSLGTTMTQSITAIDLNNMTISCTFSGKVLDVAAYVGGTTTLADASVVVRNAEWVDISEKGAKKIAKRL